jgi:DNA-directed RNA polymerase subunit RPC12/RpoP
MMNRIIPSSNRFLGLRPGAWLVIVNVPALVVMALSSKSIIYLFPVVALAWIWIGCWWVIDLNRAIRIVKSDQSLAKMQCPKCGYDLHHLSQNRCPECGTEFEFSAEQSK